MQLSLLIVFLKHLNLRNDIRFKFSTEIIVLVARTHKDSRQVLGSSRDHSMGPPAIRCTPDITPASFFVDIVCLVIKRTLVHSGLGIGMQVITNKGGRGDKE